jgi:hypothetical protein
MTGGVWLTYWRERKHNFPSPRRKIVLYINFFDEAHGGSSRPVAYLKGARLERSNGGWRRERKILTTALSIRSKQLACPIRPSRGILSVLNSSFLGCGVSANYMPDKRNSSAIAPQIETYQRTPSVARRLPMLRSNVKSAAVSAGPIYRQ